MYTKSLYLTLTIINAVFGMLFHEPSSIELEPSEDIENMAFGFSMGYQKTGKLVIGAPYGDLTGQVYTCDIEDIIKGNVVCQKVDIDVEKLTVNSTRDYPDRHYFLGASIAAADDYVITCAPFWKSSNVVTVSSCGTCFIYNGTAHLFNGPYEQFIKNKMYRHSFGNGFGWTSLYDQSNHLILLSKIFDKGHFSYISSEDPLKPSWSTESLTSSAYIRSLHKFRYIGAAVASGTFLYSGVKQTMYAFSMRTDDTYGKILFLRYTNKKLFLVPSISIDSEMINIMFGSAMLGVDMNSDGYTELLVGAPAYYEDDAYETGALYIYTGGDLATIGSANRTRLIVASKVGARFGSAVASTDVDGDGFPEIIVSAPYEDFGTGALYIIYGKELNKKCLKGNQFKETMSLSQFVSTQRLQNIEFKSFGVTLQVINDVDNNGADELAVGCPESSRVVIYRGIPSVDVTVSSQLVGEQVVRIKATNFTVRVVIDISIHEKPLYITGNLSIENSVVGNGVQIRLGQELKTISLSRDKTKCIIDVDVDIIYNDEPGTYKFTTSVKLEEGEMSQSAVLNPSWVTIYPENPTSSLDIERRCSGESCLPQLNMTLEWSGSAPYILGSTTSELVTMRFQNHGNSSYVQTCVRLMINGARAGQNTCDEQDGTYTCLLPLPIKRNEVHTLTMPIDLSNPTNDVNSLVVHVKFYNNSCVVKTEHQDSNLVIPLVLDVENIAVNGSSIDRVVTDSDVLDKTVETCENAHEYTIINNGRILWKNVVAIIKWSNQTLIKEYKVFQTSVTSDCVRQDTTEEVTYSCIFDLEPNSFYKIIPSTIILEEDVEKYLVGDTLNISSTLELYLLPTETKKEFSLTTVIKFNKELSFGQNKPLIITVAVIVALLILALVIYILRKIGFFKRNTKKKLIQEKKEDELRKSVKRPAQGAAASSSSGSAGVQNKAMESDETQFKSNSQELDIYEEDNQTDL